MWGHVWTMHERACEGMAHVRCRWAMTMRRHMAPCLPRFAWNCLSRPLMIILILPVPHAEVLAKDTQILLEWANSTASLSFYMVGAWPWGVVGAAGPGVVGGSGSGECGRDPTVWWAGKDEVVRRHSFAGGSFGGHRLVLGCCWQGVPGPSATLAPPLHPSPAQLSHPSPCLFRSTAAPTLGSGRGPTWMGGATCPTSPRTTMMHPSQVHKALVGVEREALLRGCLSTHACVLHHRPEQLPWHSQAQQSCLDMVPHPSALLHCHSAYQA